MMDDTENDLINEDGQEGSALDELEVLKSRADMMGIKYSPKIGVDALRDKIQRHMSDEKPSATNEDEEVEMAPKEKKVVPETEAQMRERLRKEALRLVRVRITCHNPSKADLRGELFLVGNKYIGNVNKFISFGDDTENGYHIPMVLYNNLKNRKYLSKRSRRGPNGQDILETRMVPEFSIEVLPDLTDKQLADLAASQAAKGGFE